MNEIINLGNGQFVKVTMLKGERGSNIASIAKTSTDGLVDTYTITLTDGHTTTFQVTNGANIGIANLGYVQISNVAQKDFAVDEHLILNDQYCKVTQAIEEGDTIAIGTNVDEAVIGDEISDLESRKADKTEVNALATEKADKTEVNQLATDKADKTALEAETNARINADNTEASTRATADANLQSQINQIIAPTGEAPSAAEVENARIGADGVTYNTLGDAIRTQDENFKNTLNIITKIIPTWTLNQSINSSGELISNQYTALSKKIPCSTGDNILTTSPTIDVNNKALVYYIVEFHNDTFLRRTEMTSSIRNVIIGSNTNNIRIVFGRYGSSGITISVSDIENYVQLYFERAMSLYDPLIMQAVKNNYAYTGNDVDDINENCFYFCPEGTENLPTNTGGYFVQTILYDLDGNASFQLATKFDNGLEYYRRKVSETWRPWICNSSPSRPSLPIYYAFGDSLTYSAIWLPTSESPYYQIIRAPFDMQIPVRIANAIGANATNCNKGVGGAYFVGNGNNTILNAIQNQDLTNAQIITIAGGRNDSENPLGDKYSTVGDGTICGAIKEILEYVTSNYKKLQIIWIGVTPNTSNNANVFTRVFAGGWSLNSFDEKVSELCAEYGVPYVDWKMCSYMRHWADFSGAGNVYSHPNNEESYLQMGNYIAGKVAQYYHG